MDMDKPNKANPKDLIHDLLTFLLSAHLSIGKVLSASSVGFLLNHLSTLRCSLILLFAHSNSNL